jgi:hypothetical protein
MARRRRLARKGRSTEQGAAGTETPEPDAGADGQAPQ